MLRICKYINHKYEIYLKLLNASVFSYMIWGLVAVTLSLAAWHAWHAWHATIFRSRFLTAFPELEERSTQKVLDIFIC